MTATILLLANNAQDSSRGTDAGLLGGLAIILGIILAVALIVALVAFALGRGPGRKRFDTRGQEADIGRLAKPVGFRPWRRDRGN